MIFSLRDSIDRAITNQEWRRALTMLRSYFWGSPNLANALLVLKHMPALGIAIQPCRLVFLRSFTIEPVVPLIRAMSGLYGIDLSVQVGDFNAYAQEILDPHKMPRQSEDALNTHDHWQFGVVPANNSRCLQHRRDPVEDKEVLRECDLLYG